MRTIYQVFYNFYTKKDEVSPNRWLEAGAATFLFVFLVGVNMTQLWSILAHTHIKLYYGKGITLTILLLFLSLTYFFLFYILKIEKNGYDGNYGKYPISKKVKIIVLTSFWVNIALAFTLPVLRKYYFEIN